MGYDWGSTRTRAPRGAFTPSPIFLGILAVFVGAGVFAWLGIGSDGFNVFVFVFAGWLVSLCLHEYAHALVAYHAGDRGVVHRGYLKLNPLKYANPLFTVVLPLLFIVIGGIALPGGAVLIDHSSVRSKRLDTMISLAGPATNAVFAAALLVPFTIGVDVNAHVVFWSAVAYLALFQVMATIINLLPIPGLDGGNALYPWLRHDHQRGFDAVRPYGFLIMIFLLYAPVTRVRIFGLLYDVTDAAGLSRGLIAVGGYLFRFWAT